MKLKESKVVKKKDRPLTKVSGDKVTKKKLKDKRSNKKEIQLVKQSLENDPQTQLEQLAKLLKCDHVISLTFGPDDKKSEVKDKFDFLVEHAFAGGLSFPIENWSKKNAFLGIKVEEGGLAGDLPQGNVVVGPEADNLHEVNSKTLFNIHSMKYCVTLKLFRYK
jgi:hypothetical protein